VAAKQVFSPHIFLYTFPALSVKCATAAGKVKQIIKFLIISNGSQGRKFIFLIVSKTFPTSPPLGQLSHVCGRKMEVNEISASSTNIHTHPRTGSVSFCDICMTPRLPRPLFSTALLRSPAAKYAIKSWPETYWFA